MKSLKQLLMILLFLLSGIDTHAQLSDSQRKERMELRSLTKEERMAKAQKMAKKAAKKLVKDGWKNEGWAATVELQLQGFYTMQMEYDENLLPVYLLGEATAIARDYSTARKEAREKAKINLVENTVAEYKSCLNHDLDSSFVSEQIAKNNLKISIVNELYRILPDKTKEVKIVIALENKYIAIVTQ